MRRAAIRRFRKTYSVAATDETMNLLERVYVTIFKETLNAGLPMISKADAFAQIVKTVAEQRGVTV